MAHPELKHVFNQSNQRSDRQSQALATAVYAGCRSHRSTRDVKTSLVTSSS
ncbi:hypothetical protein OVA29_11585 [Exiguobacterium sp. SL14]|nr:hypothetical protein [Exiguobacterium sp. SL14]